jgi:DNA modification methylase
MKYYLYNNQTQKFNYKELPIIPDIMYVDPPWNVGITKAFNTLNKEVNGVDSSDNIYTDIIDSLINTTKVFNLKKLLIEHSVKDTYIFNKMKSLEGYNFTQLDGIYGSKNLPLKISIAFKNQFVLPKQEDWHTQIKGQNFCTKMIRTYSEGCNTLIDPCCGSGMSGVGALKSGLNFIGIELRKNRFDIAENKLNKII